MPGLISDWQKAGIFESIFDQLADALLLYDPVFLVTGVNMAAERLFGKSARDLLGTHCQDVLLSALHEPLAAWQAASIPTVSALCVDIAGVERLVVLETHPIFDEAGRLAGGAATIRDLSIETSPLQPAMIAESPLMRDIIRFVRRISVSEAATVLLEGESGTGKDLIAKMLHYQSPRRAQPFIAVNCAAIPDMLMESELFGYERGAFTDARNRKRGVFELADKGTLFLDEIGDIAPTLQAKLLRVLEEHSFRRLGGLEDVELDLRIVAATNKDLRTAVLHKTFRQDLYFRLNVIQITIPPLRERVADIRPLAAFFIEHFNRRFNRTIQGLSEAAAQLLLSYQWPGNVRELRNAIERGMLLEESKWITPSSLPVHFNATA